MHPIEMVDLKRQYFRLKPEIDAAMEQVLCTAAFINGSDVKLFATELQAYLNVKHVVPCANGTDALQLALMALNLKPGDEVITSAFTFIAPIEAIALLGLTPVLVDVDPETFQLDNNQLTKAITKKTKAIIPVHLFGQCCNMQPLMDLAAQHQLFVIEDTAQALGSDYYSDAYTRKAGTIGHIGTTSFFPSKNLGCYGDGGAVFTNDPDLAERIHSLANHGMKVRYHHDQIGINSRLDTLQASILRVKLKYLPRFNAARQSAAVFYNKGLVDNANIHTPIKSTYSSHIYHQYTLKITDGRRNELQQFLKDRGIPTMVYYPIPPYLQPGYKQFGFNPDQFPVTNALYNQVLSLPMHTELDSEQLQYIIDSIHQFYKK